MGISDEMSVAFEAKANNKDPEFDDLIPRTGKKYLDGGYQGQIIFLEKLGYLQSNLFWKIYSRLG